MFVLIITTVIAYALSSASVMFADALLSERIAVIGDFAGLKYALNPGIAWGIQLPYGVQEILIFVALVLVAHLALTTAKTTTSRIGYGMILGGGSANIADRIRDGFVTDFIQIGSFPVFNIADCFVTIGVAVLMIELILHRNRKKSS